VGTSVDAFDAVEIGQEAVRDLHPPADVHASSAYRQTVGAGLVARAVRNALEEANHA